MDKFITFENEKLKLSFSKETGALKRIQNGNIIFDFSKDTLWNIALANESRGRRPLSNTDGNVFRYEFINPSTLRLIWEMQGDILNAVKVIVLIKLEDDLSYWTIKVENTSGYALKEVHFPVIGGIGKITEDAQDDYIALPWQWGVHISNPIDFIAHEELQGDMFWDGRERKSHQLAYEYPGMYSMQFSVYGHADHGGLYLGNHDGNANYKRFGFYGRKDCTEIDYILKNYPEEMDVSGLNYEMPYDAVIGIFKGNWHAASAIYKTWAVKQEWCSGGRVSDRKDIPDWVKNTGLWYWNWCYWHKKGDPETIIPALKKLKEMMAVPLAFHWYGWNNQGPDTDYPEYRLTAKDSKRLDKAVRELKTEGIKVLPYINGRLWNVDTKSWHKEKAGQYACQQAGADKSEPGKFYIEPYRDRPFVPMCPFTGFWQDKIIGKIGDIMGYGADGLYIDQVSSAYAVLCHAKNHGHDSGGNYWYKGYKTMMERLRQEIIPHYPEAAFSSESVIECFIGVFDAFLGYQCADFGNRFGQASSSIPMFSSVYHGYIPLYGTGTILEKENEFYLGMAMDINGGIMPSIHGYFSDDIDKEEYAPRLKYLEEWVKKYYPIRNMLNDAELLPPKDIKTEQVEIKLRGVNKSVPAVLTSLWKTANGDLIFLAVNHTRKNQSIMFDFDSKEYHPTGKYKLVEVGTANEKILFDEMTGKSLDIDLAPRSLKAYKFLRKNLLSAFLGVATINAVAAPPEILNIGFPGHNSRDLLAKFDDTVAIHKPDLVIVMAGTNDMLNSSNSQSIGNYRDNMREIIGSIRKTGAQVIIINLPPCNEAYVLKRHPQSFFGSDTPNGKISKANQILKEVCDMEKGTIVDIHSIFTGKPLNETSESLLRNYANSKTEDGVHPTPEGYRLIAETVFNSMKMNKIGATKIVCFGDSITYGVHVGFAGTANPDAETYPGNLARLLQNK